MTPKLKAKELFKKARKYARANIFSFREESFKTNCKGIALIAVDEMLDCDSDIIKFENHKKYWEEVKKEIKKIK
jgi:hypothetical protein